MPRRRSATAAAVLAVAASLVAVGSAHAAAPVAADDGVATQQAKLKPSDGAAADQFGYAVAISGDTAVVGSYRADTGRGVDAGAAYVYTRSGPAWTLQQKLVPRDGLPYDWFGWAVAIEGDTVVVGSRYVASRSTHSGAAYVFTRSAGVWTQEATLVPSAPSPTELFGYSVAVAGSRVAVGAPYHSALGIQSGAAYVFVNGAGVWGQDAVLRPSDGWGQDRFGFSVALSGDSALVGAPYHDALATDSGAAYVFTRGDPGWSEQRELFLTTAMPGDGMGFSVALSGDTALTGAPWRDGVGTDAGGASVFTRSGSTWSTEASIDPLDGRRNAWFGYAVALAGDRAVVGAPSHAGAGLNAGAAFALARQGGSWKQGPVDCAGIEAGDAVGRSVAVSGDTALIGAFGDDDVASNAGAAYMAVGLAPYATPEDTTLTVLPPGVLANDTDPEGDPLTAQVATTTARGTLSLAPDGSLVYVPNPDVFGIDTFTYRAFDGALSSAPATVTISVAAVNDAPVARDDPGYATDEDVSLVVTSGAGLLANDLDADADTLTASLATPPANGALALAPSGAFVYAPAADWYGTDRFTYRAFDGAAYSDVATATVTVRAVNDAPGIITAPLNLEGNVAGGYAGPLGGVTVSDADDATSTLTIGNDAPPVLALGVTVVTWNATDPAGAVGSATQSVTVTDTTRPTDPTVSSPSHTVGQRSRLTAIQVSWSGATDTCSGVDGYSFSFSSGATEQPAAVKRAEASAAGTSSPALSDGAWWFNLRTVDKAGNWTSTAHLGPFLVDSAPPATAATTLPATPDGDNGYCVTRPSVTLTADETATVRYRWDAAPWQTYGGPLLAAEGTHTLEFFAVDTAGNTETARARRFDVDLTPPVDAVPSSSSHIVGVPSDDPIVRVGLSGASDAVSGVDGFSISWSRDAAVLPAALRNLAGSVTETSSPPLADGWWWFNLRTRDRAGNWTSTSHLGPFLIEGQTTSTPPPAATTLTLSRGSTTLVSYGRWVTLTGTLTSGASAVAGRQVSIQRRSFGSSTWYPEGSAATDASGAFKRAVRVKVNSYYRAEFAGDSAYAASQSDEVWIRARAGLPRPSVPSRVHRYRPFTVSGALFPQHYGKTKVLVYRQVGRGIRYYRSYYGWNTRYSTYSRYSVRLRLPPGRWMVRAYHSDASHYATFGAPRYLTVR